MTIRWRCYTEPWWQTQPERWHEWVAAAELPLFCDTPWLDAVLRHYRPQLRLWVAFDGAEPLGALPLEAVRWHGFSAWRWLGAALHPDHLDLVAPLAHQDRLWHSFLSDVVAHADVTLLFWEGVRSTSALLTLPWPKTLVLWDRPPRRCPYIPLAGIPDIDALARYWRPKLRKELAYLHRRIARDTPNATLRAVPADAIGDTLKQLAQWSMRQHGAASAWNDPRFVAFHHDLSHSLHASAQLGLYTFGEPGTPWAIAYGFHDQGTYRYYQPAFDTAFARFSPSKMLIAALLETGIAKGWREFDFLLGDEPYKFEWGPRVREEADWRVAKGWLGRVLVTWLTGWSR